jgi:hypothetical protein
MFAAPTFDDAGHHLESIHGRAHEGDSLLEESDSD